MSVETVESRLGEPKAVDNSAEGVTTGLSYGLWQLTFSQGHLTTRSMVIVPPNGRSRGGVRDLDSAVRKLTLGTRLSVIRKKFGTPNSVYIIYEGDPEPVRILRYGP